MFQKKPDVSSSTPAYSLGTHRSVLIIGLGNPEEEYDKTRHNIGSRTVDLFAKLNDFPGWTRMKDLKSEVTSSNMGDTKVILCKPDTFMNNSGEAAQALQHFFRIYNQNTLVVYDELAIPFGQLRTRLGGSDGGHNGVKSLISHIGDDFGRLRIGIGSDVSQKADASSFVLGKFNKSEEEKLPAILKEACALVTEYIYSGSLPHDTRTIL